MIVRPLSRSSWHQGVWRGRKQRHGYTEGHAGPVPLCGSLLVWLVAVAGPLAFGQEAPEGQGAAKLPPKEPSAKLPLAQARNLSGTWMTANWYINLNMGPKGSLPTRSIPLHGVTDPGAP